MFSDVVLGIHLVAGVPFRSSKMGPEAKPRSLDEDYVSKQTGELSILRLVLALATGQKSPLGSAGSYRLQPGASGWWGWEAAVPPLGTCIAQVRPHIPHKGCRLHISPISMLPLPRMLLPQMLSYRGGC